MAWPRKKSSFTPEDQPAVEIVAHKDAHDKVVKRAAEANEYMRKLLEENHFTVAIVLGIGGNELIKRRKR